MLTVNFPQIILIAGLLIVVMGALRMFKRVRDGLLTLLFGAAVVGLTMLMEVLAERDPLDLLRTFTSNELHSEEINSQEGERKRLLAMQEELNRRKQRLDHKDAEAVAAFEESVRALEVRYERYKAKYEIDSR